MFTEKTIKRLAEIGIKPTRNKGQYCDKTLAVFVNDNEDKTSIQVGIYHRTFNPLKRFVHHTLRYETLKALKLAEQAEEIIKENGK